MATFASLTSTQQAQLIQFQLLERTSMIKFASLINSMRALNNLYVNGGVGNSIATLDAGTIIPDGNGLAGSGNMGHDESIAYMAAIQQLLATYDQPNYEAFFLNGVGPINVINVG